jgi:hypothetical protein
VHCAAGSVADGISSAATQLCPTETGAVTAVGGVTRGMLVPRSGSPASVWAVTSVAMGEGHRPQRLHLLSLRASPIPASAVRSAESFQRRAVGHCEVAESVQTGAGFAPSKRIEPGIPGTGKFSTQLAPPVAVPPVLAASVVPLAPPVTVLY